MLAQHAKRRLYLGAVVAAMTQMAAAEPQHGIAMYGDPALPADFAHLPYVNPDAPEGGRIVQGEVGSFDSLNPHILKGRVPWQLRFLAYESLMGRSWDEPFTLYGLLAETVETAPDRSWVEFTLRPEAAFSDGSPVTPEDVLWSYETLGTEGHPRYRSAWTMVESAEQVGERGVRFTFSEPDRELALIMGMRPILKKAQWEGKDFADSGLDEIPISTAPYVVADFEPGRFVSLARNPDYWGNDLPFMQGQANLDEVRMEFFGDASVMFEAFKGGVISTIRETDVEKWATEYDFPAMADGRMVQSEIPHERPSGLWGLVMNSRSAPFDDWRVREAMIQAFNYEFVNQTLNGGRLPRVQSFFSNSELGMREGAADGRVAELLAPFEDALLPGTILGYDLPEADGTERNRGNVRRAVGLLEEAGWQVGDDGALRGPDGAPFDFEILLEQGNNEAQQVVDIYVAALRRLGITPTIVTVDGAQHAERTQSFDFGMAWYERGASLSPGTEQRLYWSSEAADQPGSSNWMGMKNPAADAMIDALLTSESHEDFVAAARALDRIIMAGRYVVPIWYRPASFIAHDADLHYPENLPAYGDWLEFQPHVWWHEEG